MTHVPSLDPDDAEAAGRRAVSSQRSPRAIVGNAYRQHRDLLRNAGSLIAATGVTSILGAVYWTFAARLFSQQDVGYGAAEVPAMILLGTIGMFGLGTLLLGELPKSKRRAELVSAGLIACAFGSLLLGLGFALIAPHLNRRFAEMIGTLDQKGLFVVGVILTGVSMVLDMATVGVMRGGIQLARNIAFTLVKLVALPIFAFLLHDRLGFDIILSWVVGIALSLVVVAIRMALSGTRLLARPDWGNLRSLRRTAMAHNWINIAVTVPPTVFPVLVTVLISPSVNAAFYVAFTLSTFLYIIPTHLATVLFAMAAAEPHAIAHRVRFALKLSYVIGLPAIAVLMLESHWILSIYGAGYARIATVPIWLLTLGYIGYVPRALFIAVCRANGRITYCATILTVFAVVEVVAVAAGAWAGGLVGLSLAFLAALTAQGIAITPPLLRAVNAPRTSLERRFFLSRQQL
jgi:O-antigen/teichoic acid export membrane protein